MAELEFRPGDVIVQIGCSTRRVVLGVLNGKYDISHPIRGNSLPDFVSVATSGIAGICDRDIEKIYVKVGHWDMETMQYYD